MNISYELAEELKEAGFSQEPSGEVSEIWGDTRHSDYILWKDQACSPIVMAGTEDYKAGIERGDNLVKYPTLRELIDACGTDFNSLAQGNGDGEGIWFAFSFPPESIQRTGECAEEALGKLYLALNKK